MTIYSRQKGNPDGYPISLRLKIGKSDSTLPRPCSQHIKQADLDSITLSQATSAGYITVKSRKQKATVRGGGGEKNQKPWSGVTDSKQKAYFLSSSDQQVHCKSPIWRVVLPSITKYISMIA